MGSKLAVSLALVGLIMACINVTGLALKFPMILQTVSGGMLVPALLITGAVVIILGCGLPPFASYLIVAILCVPVLVKLGVAFLSAHFFVYYFAVFALITPPIGGAIIVAAPLAGANYLKLSVEAVKVGVVAWILPFLAIFVPAVILQPMDPLTGAIKILVTIALILFLQISITGYYLNRTNTITRLLSALCALMLFIFILTTGYIYFTAGIIIGVIVTMWQIKERKSLIAVPTQTG